MQRLLWKDFRILRSLIPCALVLTVVLDLALGGRTDGVRFDTAVAIGLLVPHLFALLAPVMLVGAERNGRTVRWLRELPIPWQRIVASRVWAALLGLLGVWILSAMNFGVVVLLLEVPADELSREGSVAPIVMQWLHLAVSSASWLMIGFVLIYLIRSPALACIPIGFFLFGVAVIVMTKAEAWHGRAQSYWWAGFYNEALRGGEWGAG